MDAKKILILGSGFAGIEVLKRIQKRFKNKDVEMGPLGAATRRPRKG